MKIKAHVLSVSDQGDRPKITAQGEAARMAEWRPSAAFEIHIPMSERNRKAYFVGRKVTLDLEPA